MAYVKIRPRRSTISGWEYMNPILSEGEMAFECPDTGVGTGLCNVKMGDGVTAWRDLPYAIKSVNLNSVLNEKDEKIDNLMKMLNKVLSRLDKAEKELEELKKNGIKPGTGQDPQQPGGDTGSGNKPTPKKDDEPVATYDPFPKQKVPEKNRKESHVSATYLGDKNNAWIEKDH